VRMPACNPAMNNYKNSFEAVSHASIRLDCASARRLGPVGYGDNLEIVQRLTL
jgi:hypothetical protein